MSSAETVVLGMAYAQIKGQAFLWHQVRPLVALQFFLGSLYDGCTVPSRRG